MMLIPLSSGATVSLGVGTSSFTYGRAAPSLDLAIESDSKWGLEFQSEGVQTTVYSQNAWILAGYKTIQEDRSEIFGASIGAGFGASYILRSYRTATTSASDKTSDSVIGPYLSAKFSLGMFYLGFNTLLGLTTEVQQHVLLNFQEVSHVTIGVTL
jgi:hypothetical protein